MVTGFKKWQIHTSISNICLIITLTACTGTSKRAEENLNLLRLKSLALDSIISVESERLKMLDSSVNSELKKVGKLDSIINVESQRIDSLLNKVYKEIEQKRNKLDISVNSPF